MSRRHTKNGAGRSTYAFHRNLARVSVLAHAADRPQRGVVILPGLGNSSSDYSELQDTLQAKRLSVKVADVKRYDWARNAAALTDINWWKGCLKPRPAVDWYLARVDAAVNSVKDEIGDAPITLLSHSAGGWLGRVYMLGFGTRGIDRFISIGSPHSPPPAGVIDQTRGILTFCSEECPGAYHAEVKYITIASRYVKGAELSSSDGWKAKFAGAGYQVVCGETEVWGDFIVPVPSAHLEGAINVDLDGAFHSPLGAKLPFLGPWYGSPEYLPYWAHYISDDWDSLAPGTYQATAVTESTEQSVPAVQPGA